MDIVAPLAGVWIEIDNLRLCDYSCKSLPSRECGLKSFTFLGFKVSLMVAPLAGVWIEIYLFPILRRKLNSRSPRGSVD